MFTLAELEAALPIVRAGVPPTPQFAWPLLRQRSGVDVVVKHENHTPTGAFKVRGGLDEYYRRNVTGGAGSFVMVAENHNSFGQAIVKKLIAEIAWVEPERPVIMR